MRKEVKNREMENEREVVVKEKETEKENTKLVSLYLWKINLPKLSCNSENIIYV